MMDALALWLVGGIASVLIIGAVAFLATRH